MLDISKLSRDSYIPGVGETVYVVVADVCPVV